MFWSVWNHICIKSDLLRLLVRGGKLRQNLISMRGTLNPGHRINMNKCTIILSMSFLYIICNKSLNIIKGKIYKEWNSQHRLWCRYFGTFVAKWINNVMNVCINKQSISFKLASAFCLSFVREMNETRFFTANSPAGKTTLCRLQKVARELWVEMDCFKV